MAKGKKRKRAKSRKGREVVLQFDRRGLWIALFILIGGVLIIDGFYPFIIRADLLTFIDSHDPGGSSRRVASDGNFIYVANFNNGLLSYSINGSGHLTFIDSDNINSTDNFGVWSDADFTYIGKLDGVYSYSVNSSGHLTFVDYFFSLTNVIDLWKDNNFLYAAQGGTGLHSYSIDNNGVFTHIDSIDVSASGIGATGIFGGSTYLYLADGSEGLFTLTVNASGHFSSIIDSYDPGPIVSEVWGNDDFIYLAYVDGVRALSINSSGHLTLIDTQFLGNTIGIWGDPDNNIYLSGDYIGNASLARLSSNNGQLTFEENYDPGGEIGAGLYGDNNFIYFLNDVGLHTYRLPCTESWSCTAFSSCVGGTQTRTCTDANTCGTELTKPAENQSCNGGGGGGGGGPPSEEPKPFVHPPFIEPEEVKILGLVTGSGSGLIIINILEFIRPILVALADLTDFQVFLVMIALGTLAGYLVVERGKKKR